MTTEKESALHALQNKSALFHEINNYRLDINSQCYRKIASCMLGAPSIWFRDFELNPITGKRSFERVKHSRTLIKQKRRV